MFVAVNEVVWRYVGRIVVKKKEQKMKGQKGGEERGGGRGGVGE